MNIFDVLKEVEYETIYQIQAKFACKINIGKNKILIKV